MPDTERGAGAGTATSGDDAGGASAAGQCAVASNATKAPPCWAQWTYEQRRRVGLQCKRLVDHGRVCYLRQRGYQCRLVYFVPEECSPENALLLCWKASEASAKAVDAGDLGGNAGAPQPL